MDLNPQQKEAASAPHGPLLIVAGAGTGKTRTLTARVIRLIEKGIPPEKICAITFTNKAAGEMRERVLLANNKLRMASGASGDSLRAISNLPFVGTFHSFGAKILRKEAHHLDRKPNFVIFDNHDSFDLIKKIVKKLIPKKRGEERKRSKHESPAFFAKKIDEIKNVADAEKKLRLSPKEEDQLAIIVFERYETALKENNAFDFDDLIGKVVWLLQNNEAALKKYRNKFDAILVDEYQDLNPMQYELIKLLAGEHKNLSVVGDDEQLIYGWRHADLKIFLNFERDWPGARVTFLEENYRSTSNIIDAAAAVAENNQYRRPKTLWTKSSAGEPVEVAEVVDENEEAEFIAKTIKITNKSGGGDHNSDDSNHSVAILYRTNAQSRAIEQALIRHKIQYRVFGGMRFYERREVKDVVAALRYALNTKDEISFDRLEKLLGKRKFPGAEEKLLKARGVDPSPTNIIETFVSATNYFEYLENNFIDHEERRENIGELLNFSKLFNDTAQMLEEVALVQSTDNPSTSSGSNQPSVDLMTIHLAKGLEFDNVFIVGCSEGIMPHAMSMDNNYRLEEERRLMYVAMTRARKKLSVSFYDVPSRFIGEMPNNLTTFRNTITNNTYNDNDEEVVRYDDNVKHEHEPDNEIIDDDKIFF